MTTSPLGRWLTIHRAPSLAILVVVLLLGLIMWGLTTSTTRVLCIYSPGIPEYGPDGSVLYTPAPPSFSTPCVMP